ncbi:hypothetical protein MNEG_1093 [Monoraphidium neglectum]|uniref:Uncharacterized protein n=1 Tax=Monoraphidium neglectum TaxID=145388 RepID=A0A0D2NRC5_9CHLO|nr:hypothetical protein MNEG_1093 [Monoraphidium neglectum]KIZ06861.1 hypothetical protein MNEG_1093 [Monoraphidium neglectum]|eukprot:XP_013905880.1 hypothetical protein MNEG_1093 [Monoraphidium neglectum]
MSAATPDLTVDPEAPLGSFPADTGAAKAAGPDAAAWGPAGAGHPLGEAAGGDAPPALLLSPGRRAAVSVLLRLPPYDQDLFQVTGELLAADGKLLGRSARTHMPRLRPTLPRMLHYVLTTPWAALGLYDDSEHVELVLFDSFAVPGPKPPRRPVRRRRGSGGAGAGGDAAVAPPPASGPAPAPAPSAPVPVFFRARLIGRSPANGPPKVYSADMRLRLRLGWIESFLYHLSPGPLLAVVLLASGVAMTLGGGGFAGALLVAAVAILRWGARAAERVSHAPPDRRHAGAAASAAGGGGAARFGDAGASGGDDASSGQWSPVGKGGAAASGSRGAVGGPGADGAGQGTGGISEPSSPYDGPSPFFLGTRQRGGRDGKEEEEEESDDEAVWEAPAQSVSVSGLAVGAIRGMVGAGARGGGGAARALGAGGGGGGAGAAARDRGERDAAGEGWQHVVAGGSDGEAGSPQRGAGLTQRRGWPFSS